MVGFIAPACITHRVSSNVRGGTWIVYNVIMFTVIVVSGAILFMCMVGMIQLKDKHTKNEWIEINSQILNGVFTWMAFTNHPFYFYQWRQVVSVLTNTNTMPQAVKYLRTVFPIIFANDLDTSEAHGSQSNVLNDPLVVECIPCDVPSVKALERILLILNFNCIFQYPITIVMWGFNATTRPGYIVGIFLPLSFLCNIVGQVRLYKLNQRIIAQRRIAAETMTMEQGSSD